MESSPSDSPHEVLQRVAAELGCTPTSRNVALYLDKRDPLQHLRKQFLVPRVGDLPPSEFMCLGKVPFARAVDLKIPFQ